MPTHVFDWTSFVTLAAALGFVSGSSAVPHRQASALRLPVPGMALRNTNLRLIVAGSPPLAVDVDTRRVSAINVPGASSNANPSSSVIQLGTAAALVGSAECASCGRNQPVFFVRPGDLSVTPVGQALQVAPAGPNRGGWFLRSEGSGRCAIQRVGIDGQAQRARPSRCTSELGGQTPPGLIVNRSLLEDPASGRVLLRASGMRAASGAYVLRSPANDRLLLQNFRTRMQHRLRWPSAYGFVQGAVVRPSRGQIAVWFISGPVDQHIDVWLLDVATRSFKHVPGFPVAAELKRTSLTWTADGRLVILTRIRGADALVVWRPGARKSASGFLQLLPSREAGAQAVVAW